MTLAARIRAHRVDRFSKATGITKTWLAAQLDMSPHAFHYALKRGLSEEEAYILDDAISTITREMNAFDAKDLIKTEGE